MPFRNVVVGQDECRKGRKKLLWVSGDNDQGRDTYPIIVLVQVFCHHGLVPSKRFLQIGERVTRDAKRGCFDVVREHVESWAGSVRVDRHVTPHSLFRVEQDFCKLFMPKHLSQNHAGVECDFFIGISCERSKDDFFVSSTDIFDGG